MLSTELIEPFLKLLIYKNRKSQHNKCQVNLHLRKFGLGLKLWIYEFDLILTRASMSPLVSNFKMKWWEEEISMFWWHWIWGGKKNNPEAIDLEIQNAYLILSEQCDSGPVFCHLLKLLKGGHLHFVIHFILFFRDSF